MNDIYEKMIDDFRSVTGCQPSHEQALLYAFKCDDCARFLINGARNLKDGTEKKCVLCGRRPNEPYLYCISCDNAIHEGDLTRIAEALAARIKKLEERE